MKTRLIEAIRKNLLGSKHRQMDCKHCNAAIEEIIENFKGSKKFIVVFTPDENASGYITHWHIDTKNN